MSKKFEGFIDLSKGKEEQLQDLINKFKTKLENDPHNAEEYLEEIYKIAKQLERTYKDTHQLDKLEVMFRTLSEVLKEDEKNIKSPEILDLQSESQYWSEKLEILSSSVSFEELY
jgi:hypothetical protein